MLMASFFDALHINVQCSKVKVMSVFHSSQIKRIYPLKLNYPRLFLVQFVRC